MRAGNVSDLTGCPFSDAYLAGLVLEPRLIGGPARLQGRRLLWDPSRPMSWTLRELAKQTAKWRARRGLHIVRTPIAMEGTHDDVDTTIDVRDRFVRRGLANTNATRRSQQLRAGSAASDSTDRMQSDAADMRMRRAWKLPLGV